MYSGVRAWQCVKSAKKRTLTVSRFVYIYIYTHRKLCVCVYTHENTILCSLLKGCWALWVQGLGSRMLYGAGGWLSKLGSLFGYPK